ncbi:MAG TPA: hypothetical protein VGY30_10795 [Solirubrobacteraceae bacterium]|jgi:hypothetical protein|nr:hypothetical protein [Solirubrobacteraceae bacterium]
MSSWLPHIPVADEKAATENFERIAAQIIVGQGNPEGKVGAPVGVIYVRADGNPGATLYVKESAASPTDPNGWAAK